MKIAIVHDWLVTYAGAERVLEEISFDAPTYRDTVITIDRAYVSERVGEVAADDDLSNFIL